MLIQDDTLTLRRLCAEDLSAFQSYRTDPVVGAFQSWDDMTDAEALAFLQSVAEGPLLAPGRWSQLAVEADGLVGDMGLCLSADGTEVEIGLTLSRGAQGLGYGTRAARLGVELVWRETQAQCIRAITDARNTRALALIARTSFKEGAPLETDGIAERQFTLERPKLP